MLTLPHAPSDGSGRVGAAYRRASRALCTTAVAVLPSAHTEPPWTDMSVRRFSDPASLWMLPRVLPHPQRQTVMDRRTRQPPPRTVSHRRAAQPASMRTGSLARSGRRDASADHVVCYRSAFRLPGACRPRTAPARVAGTSLSPDRCDPRRWRSSGTPRTPRNGFVPHVPPREARAGRVLQATRPVISQRVWGRASPASRRPAPARCRQPARVPSARRAAAGSARWSRPGRACRSAPPVPSPAAPRPA